MTRTFETRTYGKVTFTKTANNWSYNISKHHNILVIPVDDRYIAREQKVPKHGKWMEGKEIIVIKEATGKTIKEALLKI